MVTELPRLVRFPDCIRCPYSDTGPAELCMTCAERRLERPGPDACTVCCQRCGPSNRCPNELCRSPTRRIDRIHAIGYQTGPLRQAINDYKFRGQRSMDAVFGRILLSWLEETMTNDPPDLILANPSFVGRGGQLFAHTEAVLQAAAREAAERPTDMSHWRFDTAGARAIVKTKATLRSSDMQAWSKRAAAVDLKHALRVPDTTRTRGRYLLVYDDVCTTGSQLDSVAGCLLDQGEAARVDGVVLARAPWRGNR